MRAVARLRAFGILCFRVHSDRGEGLSWGVLGKVFGRTRHSPDGPPEVHWRDLGDRTGDEGLTPQLNLSRAFEADVTERCMKMRR